ncbi:DUF2742 domain-containing protein [Williamsia sp. 1135]|uniref:DUF2742 domain-containing protein n=1 Tax=Williamsia sp. 1135 TaxID=1889262 RepID=UPI000A120858|nr:DUF2742 domain-containing protein [Williamsia sp. 1135]ORM38171.1 hypothetical protein BFL43_00895 [Williamsia sp. 1135]
MFSSDDTRPAAPPVVQQIPAVSWSATHQFVAALQLAPSLPIAGSEQWCAADDAVKFLALVLAGDRWALEQEMLQIQQRRYLAKLSAIEIAQAKDWTAVARQLRDRDAFLRDHADWAVRKVAS